MSPFPFLGGSGSCILVCFCFCFFLFTTDLAAVAAATALCGVPCGCLFSPEKKVCITYSLWGKNRRAGVAGWGKFIDLESLLPSFLLFCPFSSFEGMDGRFEAAAFFFWTSEGSSLSFQLLTQPGVSYLLDTRSRGKWLPGIPLAFEEVGESLGWLKNWNLVVIGTRLSLSSHTRTNKHTHGSKGFELFVRLVLRWLPRGVVLFGLRRLTLRER